MAIPFYKYQGTGNDFIIIDNRQSIFSKNDTKLIAKMCDRNFGIGADGLILLEEHNTANFTMVYFNSDGKESSMCGNGGRCLVHVAHFLGVIEGEAEFEAIDGMHTATVSDGQIRLKMNDVTEVNVFEKHVFLNTGSPHHVQMVNEIEDLDVKLQGKRLRYGLYGETGANINFVKQVDEETFQVRTYERGVENETLSCGTGVTAVAIAMAELGKSNTTSITLKTPGGDLQVHFDKTNEGYSDIFLEGPAEQVFKGEWL
ncbi:diaminopimelate epimerase [Luteirhabdus pelagi]|uniref:diaminopimelate epimerase n=1 Tax=Luteirhabdus pelagi TaxID=2792783 RepID=UPI001939DCFE|nr:diaminopimelate epimerase [Luteirhabdus pelagi]